MVLIQKIQHDPVAAPARAGQGGHFEASAVMELKWPYLRREPFALDTLHTRIDQPCALPLHPHFTVLHILRTATARAFHRIAFAVHCHCTHVNFFCAWLIHRLNGINSRPPKRHEKQEHAG
ncbi:hypothetical protein PSAC2689_160051 [Paraburkholderia sacchari]